METHSLNGLSTSHTTSHPLIIVIIVAMTLAACGQEAHDTPAASPEPEATPSAAELVSQEYAGIGVVVSFMAEKKYVNIDHETITDFMDAMTMPFEVKDPTLLQDIQAGDSITFRFTVANGIHAIEKIP